MDQGLHQLYASAMRYHASSEPLILLHIGAQESAVMVGGGGRPEIAMTLHIGSQKTAHDFFRHEPPTLGEIEAAIQQVEDEITRARELAAAASQLYSLDESVLEIARIATGTGQQADEITVSEVEQVFSLLAAYVQGRPASRAGIPLTAEFAATVLILREFMHHLNYASIRTPQRASAAP